MGGGVKGGHPVGTGNVLFSLPARCVLEKMSWCWLTLRVDVTSLLSLYIVTLQSLREAHCEKLDGMIKKKTRINSVFFNST